MTFQISGEGNQAYLFSTDAKIASESDALDWVAACGEFEVDQLLLIEDNLVEDFYNLRSGLAGSVLQKFINYHIRAAAVISIEKIGNGRFYEMVLEANRANHFHVSHNQADAVAWLTRS